MNFSYFTIILDYFSILKPKERIFDLLGAALLSVLSLIMAWVKGWDIQYDFIQSIINFLGVLLGFTLAAMTLIISSNLANSLKEFRTEREIRGKQCSLYRVVIASFAYLVIIETFLCISYYIGLLFVDCEFSYWAVVLNTIFIFATFHVLLATIRIVGILYIILTKEK